MRSTPPPLQPATYILLYRVGGGEPEVAPGPPETGDLGPWTADGKGVFVNERDNFTIHVFRRDLATGQRTRRKDFSFDTAGMSWFNPLIAADGQSVRLQFRALVSSLDIVDGLR